MKVELIITNDEGKQTAGMMLGEMNIEDVLDREIDILQLFLEKAKQQRATLK